MQNSMGSPAPVRLREPRVDLTLQSIVSDPEWRRYFGALADHYSRVLSDTIGDSHLVAELGEVVYLIDADVVRNVTQIRYKDSRLQRESFRLFQNTQFQFAIPLGAFQELVEWLQGIVPNKITWTEDSLRVSLTPEETVRELARAFDVSGPDADPIEIVERISAVVEAERPVVERLLDILTRPNFRGVVADYEYHDVDRLGRIVGQMDRSPSDRNDSRVTRDFRDAVNLAIVCQSSRLRADRKVRNKAVEKPSYVLVTQTQLLLDLAKNLHNSADESTLIFSSLLGLKSTVLPGLYPCMSPRRAFIVEEVRRRSGLSRVSIKTLSSERQNFQDLADALRTDESEGHKEPLPELTTKATDALDAHLEHLVDVYHRSDPLFRILERDRVWEASLRIFEEKHRVQGSPERGRIRRFKFETESFFKVLHRLQQLIAKLSPTSYRLKREPDETGTLEELTIYSEHPGEMVVQGEIYLEVGPDGSRRSRAYSFRWPTSCTDYKFFAAVRGITESNRRAIISEKELRFLPALALEDVQEGLIVFTNLGTYRSPVMQISGQISLRQLSLERIYRALRTAISDDRAEIAIEAIRVCTPFGDFQVDFVGDGSGEREVFIISHVNIGEQISHLCESTCMYAIVPIKLNAILQTVTTEFPRFAGDRRETRRR
jgi:hypothetical protein